MKKTEIKKENLCYCITKEAEFLSENSLLCITNTKEDAVLLILKDINQINFFDSDANKNTILNVLKHLDCCNCSGIELKCNKNFLAVNKDRVWIKNENNIDIKYNILPFDINNIATDVRFSIFKKWNKQSIITDIKFSSLLTDEYNFLANMLTDEDYENIYDIYMKLENRDINSAIKFFINNLDKRFEKIAFNCLNWFGDHFNESSEIDRLLKEFGLGDNLETPVEQYSLKDKIKLISSTANYLSEVYKHNKEDFSLAIKHLGMSLEDENFFEIEI